MSSLALMNRLLIDFMLEYQAAHYMSKALEAAGISTPETPMRRVLRHSEAIPNMMTSVAMQRPRVARRI